MLLESEGVYERFIMESGYRKRVGQPNKFGSSWFSVNRRIYIHESTLFKLREINDRAAFLATTKSSGI